MISRIDGEGPELVDAQFQALFACLPDAALIIDDERICVRANPAAGVLLGAPAADLAGRDLGELCGYQDFVAEIRPDGGAPAHVKGECAIRSSQNERRQVEWTLCPEFLPARHLLLLRDTTESKATETALRESENRFYTFMDNSPAMAVLKDAEGNYVYFNKTVERMAGVELEELRGKTNFHRLPYATARQLRANDLEVLNSGRSSEFVESIPTPDGGVHHWLTTKFPLQDGAGRKMVGMVAVDITDRLLIETTLRESEERYRSLFELSPLPMWVVDDETQRFLAVNRAAIEHYGYDEAEFLSLSIKDVRLMDDLPVFEAAFQRASSGFSESMHSRHRKKDGSTVQVEVRWHSFGFNGRGARLVVATDVTERLRATAELEARTREVLEIWESMTDAFFAADDQWRVTRVNTQATLIWGKSREELLGKNLWHVFPSAVGTIFYREYNRALAQQVKVDFEAYYPPLDCWFEIHLYPSSGGVSVYFRDISERKQVETALRESEERNRRIVETAREGIWLVDKDYRTTYVNRRMAKMLGYVEEEMLGKSPLDFVFEEDMAAAQAVIEARKQGLRDRYDTRYRRKNGEEVWMLGNTQPLMEQGEFAGAFGMFTDITERKRAAEERERLLEQVSAGREKLQVLSRRLVEVHEIERRNIARELHDEIGQTLTGLKLILEMNHRAQRALEQRFLDAQVTTPPSPGQSAPPPKQPPRLDAALELVNGLMEQVRELSLTLRPTMLDDLGLLPTLLWHFERYEAQTQIKVSFGHANLERRFAPEIETAAYRIVQEALTNVARYARVTSVSVRLWANEDMLGIEIRDDGVGFDARAEPALGSGGLTGMRERALLLQGQLEIRSEPGAGTSVIGELPLGEPALDAIERRQEVR